MVWQLDNQAGICKLVYSYFASNGILDRRLLSTSKEMNSNY